MVSPSSSNHLILPILRFVNASPPLPPPRRGSESVPGSPQHFRTRIHYTPEPQRRIYRTIDQWVALQIMVMWYWYGFVDDDYAADGETTTTTTAATTCATSAGDEKELAHFDIDAPSSSTSARDLLAAAGGIRSFSHSGSVTERLDDMMMGSSGSSLSEHEDFHVMPASAPAFSSLSLDADDLDAARMRRAKYWLRK